MEEQGREEQVIDQALGAIPHRAVQGRVSANDPAKGDQQEVRQQDEGIGHARSLPALVSRAALPDVVRGSARILS